MIFPGPSRKERSVFYRYLVSFVVILIVPLIILGFLLYRNSVVVLKNNIETLKAKELSNVQISMDNEISELEKISLRIAYDRSLNQQILQDNEYNAYLAISLLGTHVSSSKLSPEVFLHFRDSNVLYSSQGKLRVSTLIDYIYHFKDAQKNDFLGIFWNTDQPEVLGKKDYTYSSKEEGHYITFFFPIPTLDKKPHTVVFFAIREAKLLSCLKHASADNGSNLYILDEIHNEIVSLQAVQLLAVKKARAFLAGANQVSPSSDILDKSRYFISELGSTAKEWTYLSVTPIDHMLQGVRKAKRHSLIVIICVALLGIALATALSRFNYSPIRKLWKKLRSNPPTPNKPLRKNEIAEIEDRIDNTLLENRILTERINAQKPILREQVFLMLLRGEPAGNDAFQDLCRLGAFDIKKANLRVMVLAFNDRERSGTTFRDISSAVHNALDSILNVNHYEVIELGHNEIALILCSRQVQFNRNLSSFFAGSVLDSIRNKLSIKVTVGAGKLYSDTARMKDSYLEALAALDQIMLKETGRVIFFEDILSSEHSKYWYPIEELARLVQSLKQGNMRIFQEIVDEIIGNVAVKKLSSSMRRSICFGIVNTVINTVNEMSIEGFADEIESLTKFESLDHLQLLLERTVEKICTHIDEQKHSINEELKHAIMEYVREQYRNRMLSLDMLADHFGFSAGYLGRTFKDITGSGFAEFIRRLRVDEAKRLLRRTRKNVKSVVREIGYSDVPNFTRTFRLMEGITPSQYRNLHRIYSMQAQNN
jgi:AraC-like DNA-binding protein